MSFSNGRRPVPLPGRPALQVVNYPHSALRHRSKPVRRVDAELKSMIRQMFDLMYANKGVGLAANQVALPLRLFIVNLEGDPAKGQEMIFINPVSSQPKGSGEQEEGCLSFPNLFGNVIRPKQVRVNAYDLTGREIDTTLDGMLARVVQHEIDHLDGVLFVDRMHPTARMKIQDEIEAFDIEFQSQRASGQYPDEATIQARLRELEQRYCLT